MFGPGDLDEDLDTGPRRSYPRWWGPLLGVVLVAAGLAVVARGTGSQHPSAPTRTATATGRNLAAPPDPSARALVGETGRGVFVDLVGDRLQLLRPDGTVLRRSAPVGAVRDPADTVVLCVDAAAGTVWVVSALNNDGRFAESFSLDGLRLQHRVHLPSPIRGAAAVGGRLYVLEAESLAVLDRNGSTFDPVPLGGYVQSITADPTRQRLLGVVGSSAGVLTLRTVVGGAPGPVTTALPGNPTVVAVVGGVIWIDNYESLVSLDPARLTVRFSVPVVHSAGGIRLVGVGDASLFVRPVDSEHPLECLDAGTGRLVQYWSDVPGTVAATRHRAVIAPLLGPPRGLALTGCPG